MATVSKRQRKAPGGEIKTSWQLTYMDANGKRHRPQFATKFAADAERIRVEGELAGGIHVPDKDALTVESAATKFLADFHLLVQANKRERCTYESYETCIDLHIKPYAVAKLKMSRLNGPDCNRFARALEADVSDSMAKRVFTLFRQVVGFALSNGWIMGNPAQAISIRTAGDRAQDDTVVIPSKDQLKTLFETAKDYDQTGRAGAMISLLMFGGLRASEMRGLLRRNLFLNDGIIKITQRADRWGTLGSVKTANGRREIPVPTQVIDALKHWLKNAPTSELGLVFPTGTGTVESYTNIYHRRWLPIMTKAGLVTTDKEDTIPNFALHTLRHVACSLWIEQGAKPKQVTTWAGHASIQFTMDRYGHLWADPHDDKLIVSAAAKSILG
jgi:integrase